MLQILANNHDVWVRMVISFGCDYDTAQDIVQDFYLRAYKYIDDESKVVDEDNEVRAAFVYVMLKNMWKTIVKNNQKYQFFDIWDEEGAEEFADDVRDTSVDIAFENLLHKISGEMSTWHRYDRILSEKYFKSDYSLRDIASGSGISLTSIFNSIKVNKKILKEKFSEDWEDFKNGDYNLI